MNTLEQEAQMKGESPSATVQRLLALALVGPTRPARRVPTEAQLHAARRLRGDGREMREICEALGLSPVEAWQALGMRELFVSPAGPQHARAVIDRAVASAQGSAPQGECLVSVSPAALRYLEAMMERLGSGTTRDTVVDIAIDALWQLVTHAEVPVEGPSPEVVPTPAAPIPTAPTPTGPTRAATKTRRRKELSEWVGTPRYRQVLAKEASKLRRQGASWQSIADKWNDSSLPTLSGVGRWHAASVYQLVKAAGP
jgi:hypothetical protein